MKDAGPERETYGELEVINRDCLQKGCRGGLYTVHEELCACCSEVSDSRSFVTEYHLASIFVRKGLAIIRCRRDEQTQVAQQELLVVVI